MLYDIKTPDLIPEREFENYWLIPTIVVPVIVIACVVAIIIIVKRRKKAKLNVDSVESSN